MRALAAYTILLSASVLPLVPLTAAAEGPAVVGLSGQWTLNDGKTEVHFGQPLPKGTKLLGHKGDHVVIQCDGAFDNQSCPAKDCQVEVCAKQTLGGGKERFQWLTSSATLLSRTPDRFITAVTRGLGPDPCWEAVVELNADQVNLAPAVDALPEGRYRLRITNLPQNPTFVAEHAIRWSPGRTAEFAVSGIKPGVYSMVIMEGPGDVQGSEAWLLVTTGPIAPSLLQTWEQVKASVAPWRDDVEPPYLHAFLRATLVSLQESTPGSAAGR